MKVTIWTLAKSGSHGELVVTAHTTKDHARKMLEHALVNEEISHVGHECHELSKASLSDLQEAWEVHFDGPCLIEPHEVEIQFTELDKTIIDLKNLISVANFQIQGSYDLA
jgi:hypothetical protein